MILYDIIWSLFIWYYMIPFWLTLTPADVHISHEIFSVPWNAHPTTGIRTCCTTGRFAPLAWPFVLDPWQSARTSSVPWHNQVKGTKYQFLPGYIRYIYILYTVYIYIYIHTYTVRDITFLLWIWFNGYLYWGYELIWIPTSSKKCVVLHRIQDWPCHGQQKKDMDSR